MLVNIKYPINICLINSEDWIRKSFEHSFIISENSRTSSFVLIIIDIKSCSDKMSKRDQVLVIEPPNELTFTGENQVNNYENIIYLCFILGPFTSAVSSYMKLKNPSDKKVCFKIKTTAPKK